MDEIREQRSTVALGRLTAFLSRMYDLTAQSYADIEREIHHCEGSKSETARAKLPRLYEVRSNREVLLAGFEMLVKKAVKEERLAGLSDEDRAFFEGIYGSPEYQRFAGDS